jgi:hypothetical protein
MQVGIKREGGYAFFFGELLAIKAAAFFVTGFLLDTAFFVAGRGFAFFADFFLPKRRLRIDMLRSPR